LLAVWRYLFFPVVNLLTRIGSLAKNYVGSRVPTKHGVFLLRYVVRLSIAAYPECVCAYLAASNPSDGTEYSFVPFASDRPRVHRFPFV
jgi:hypothetical protein